MINAFPIKVNYKELLERISCNLDNRNCMLRNCNNCPNVEILKEYIIELFNENNYNDDDIIKYRQWITTDRSELLIQHVDISYYIDKLVYRLDNLKPHHFITKTQASYLKNIKDNLDNKTAIVLLDYAENYNFIYQDAIQSVHWDNTQATLHPAVIYVNNNNNLIVNSTCILLNHMIHN